MKLFNTTTRSIENFSPINKDKVTFYSCGPTVYDFTHIGHLRTYTNNDILRRVLKAQGFSVELVMNITDVGHLTDDGDSGEQDKLEKGAQKFGKTVYEVAEFFTEDFFASTDALGIMRPDVVCKATEHIDEMIALIKTLEEKGFTYESETAVYFDTSKDSKYGSLSGQKLNEKQNERADVVQDEHKKNPADFVLWFKRVGRFENHTMHWNSPWGDGFPGWHIECSAMSMKYLGNTIDIHAGGVDHIPTHHENERAQSECATGETFVRYWMHSEHLMVDGQKMSKSLGNLYAIKDLQEKGIEPLALRYLYLQTHYRKQLNFTWQSLEAADVTLKRLYKTAAQLKTQTQRQSLSEEKLEKVNVYGENFKNALAEDLGAAQGLAVMWDMLKSNIPSEDKYDLLLEMDEVLGLNIRDMSNVNEQELRSLMSISGIELSDKKKIEAAISKGLVSEEQINTAKNIQKAREIKDYHTSDALKISLAESGIQVQFLPKGNLLILLSKNT